MHAWLCENPVGVDALQWKELPTPAAQGRRSADRDQGRQPELPRPADRAEQVPDEAAAALRAGLRVRRRGRSGRRRRDAPEGRPERGLPVGHRRLRHPHHRARRAVHAAAAGLSARGCGGLHHDLRHLAPRAGGPRAAQGRRNRAGAGRGRRRRHLGDPDRQGHGRARDRRGLHATRNASCASRIGADATINYSTREPARGDQGSSPAARART